METADSWKHQLAEMILSSDSPYAILKISRTASLAEAKAAFRQIALTLHPDKTSLSSAAEAFTKASNALQQLKGECRHLPG